MAVPRRVWVICTALSTARIVTFLFVYFSDGGTASAQWQLAFLPFLAIDFPASALYELRFMPIPLTEAIVGPIWWFLMPLGVWWLVVGRRSKRTS